MSGIFGLIFTVVFFYVDATWQKAVFLGLGIAALVITILSAWKKMYIAPASPIQLDVDCRKSHVLIHDRKAFPDTVYPDGRVFHVVESIDIKVRARFNNSSNNTVLVTGVDASLKRKRRFRKSRQTGSWNTPLGNLLEITHGAGLSVPGPSKSDFQILKWSIGIKEDPRAAFVDSDYVLVLTVHALGLQGYQVEFDLDWENQNFARLSEK